MGWSIHHPQGLIHHDSRKAFEGYTLFSMSGGTEAYLIGMDGGVCHRWKYEAGFAYGFFLTNGNILMRTRSSGGSVQISRGETGIIELDWHGNVVWEYWHPLAHLRILDNDLQPLAHAMSITLTIKALKCY